MPAPQITSTDSTESSITINWDAVPNATKYYVSYGLEGGSLTTKSVAKTVTTFTLSNLDAGKTYQLSLYAGGDGTATLNSPPSVVSVTTKSSVQTLPAPQITSTETTESSITINWDAVPNATKYYVSYALEGGSFTTKSVAKTATTFTLSDLAAGDAYQFKVRAIGDGTTTLNSPFGDVVSVTVGSAANKLDAPILSVVTKKTNAITVGWKQVEGATGYLFEYMTESASSYTSITLAASKYQRQISGLSEGEIVNVRITALGGGGVSNSNYSEITVATQQTLASPVVTLTEATEDSLSFAWEPIEHTLGYRVMYIAAGDSEYTTIDVGVEPELTLNGLAMDTGYSVKVSALGDGVDYKTSAYSVLTAYRTINPLKLVAPTISSVDASKDSILLHWDAVPNATKYYVAYAPVGATKFTTKSVPASKTYYQITDLNPNAEYQIKLRSLATGTEYINSSFSPISTISTTNKAIAKTALDAPTTSARALSSDSIYVEWNANPRATGYTVIYKEKSAAAYTTVNVAAKENSLTIPDLDENSTYYVKVRALADGVFWSNSPYCGTISVKTRDASNLSATEYDDLRQRYNKLTLPESLADVNIIVLADWTADAMINALETARSTPIDDIILLDPTRYSGAPLDLSSATITLDVNYETSGSISILSRNMERAQIKVNYYDPTFTALDGLTQFGGFDFIDVSTEVSVYSITSTPALGVKPTAVETDDVGFYTPSGISIANSSKKFIRRMAPIVSETPSANDYAVLFVGGYDKYDNLEEFYVTLVDYYYELVEDFSLDPQKIYILYADGVVDGTSQNLNLGNVYYPNLTASDMSFATSLGTTVRAATGPNLTTTFKEIGNLMTADSHLLFYTEDHGDGREQATRDYNDYLCGWGANISGAMVRDAVFQIPQGYVTCVFTQCFSGGILDDIFDPATGALSGRYTGAAHFAGGAAANHYECSWFGKQGNAYVGYPQTFLESLRYCTTGTDAFIYTEQNDPFSAVDETYAPNQGVFADYIEHPWHAGETFSIFANEIEQSAPTITSYSSTPNSITLSWSADVNAGFTLEYAQAGSEDVITIDNIGTNSYTVTGLTPATNYVLRVKSSSSPFSAPASIWTKPGTVQETPSTVVTTELDVVNSNDGLISLREAVAIYSQGGDTITFDSSLRGKTIELDASRGQLYVNKNLTIDASNLYNSSAQSPGLSISGGDATRILWLAQNNKLVLKGLEFTRGKSPACGGAIWDYGELVVDNCVFSDNNATYVDSSDDEGWYYGGAIAVKPNAKIVANSTVFSGNVGAGAVSFQTDTTSEFNDCAFLNNGTTGVYIECGSVNLTDCVVEGNTATGIYLYEGAVVAKNVIVRNNEVHGVLCDANGVFEATNCLIVDNNGSYGAGLELFGTARLYNCTISGNVATRGGGGIDLDESAKLYVYNSIVAGNSAPEGKDINLFSSDATAYGYNVLTSFGDWEEEVDVRNYNATDVLFTDAENGDYTLANGSVAIDAGNDEYLPNGAAYDLLGNVRVQGNNVDLGAYEFQSDGPVDPEPTRLPTPEAWVDGVWTTFVSLAWSSSQYAMGHVVQYSDSYGHGGELGTYDENESMIDIVGLQPGTRYGFSVYALGDGDLYTTSYSSEPVYATTNIDAPKNFYVVWSGDNSATASWDSVDGAVGYQFAYKETSSSAWTLLASTITETNVTIAGLDSSKSYNLRVAALGNDANSDWSEATLFQPTPVILLQTPTITSTSSTDTSITANWDAIANASGYTVAYKKSDASSFIFEDVASDVTSWTKSGLDSNTTYTVKVRANGTGRYLNSDYSEPVDITTGSPRPVTLSSPTITSTSATSDSISLTWTAVANRSAYKVEYKLSSASSWSTWSNTITATNATIENLQSGKTYSVRVTALGDGTYYSDSDPSAVCDETTKFDAPSNFKVSPGVNQATASWNSVSGATSYTVACKKSSESTWSITKTVSTTRVTISGLDGATSYDFKVMTNAGAASSDWTDVVTVIVQEELETPSITYTSATSDSIYLRWTAVEHRQSYLVEYKPQSSSTWKTWSSQLTGTSTSITGLQPDTLYNLRVATLGDRTYYEDSDYSDVVDQRTEPDEPDPEQLLTPTGLKLTLGDKKFTATWNPVTNADHYTLAYKATSASSWTYVTVTSPSYTSPALAGATKYDVKVMANGDGVNYLDSPYTSVVQLIVPEQLATPTGLKVTGHTDTSISIQWNAVDHASKYRVKYVAGSQTKTVDTTSTSIPLTGLSQTTQYAISVMAVGDGTYYLDSNYSGSVSQKTKESASVVVNSTSDAIDAYDGQITLREALITYRSKGTTVTFASNMSGKTITLNSEISLSQAATINGSSLSSAVTISGANKNRILSLSGASFTINKVRFTQGKSTSSGGAINLASGTLNVNNCTFTSNSGTGTDPDPNSATSSGGGGAIYVGVGATLTATDSTFTSNTVTGGRGGAVHAYGGAANFLRCTLQNNTASGGGAIAYSNGPGANSSRQGKITNCLITNNTANARGGGVAVFKNAYVQFYNDTIAKNSATNYGGGVYVWNNTSKAEFYNSIVMLNSASQSGQGQIGVHPTLGAPTINAYRTLSGYTDWTNSAAATNYKGQSPFVNADGGDFTLKSGSISYTNANGIQNISYATGAGRNDKVDDQTIDLAGRTRKVGSHVDLGCYEHQSNSGALLDDDAELFDEFEDSLDLIAASLLD